MHTLSDIQIGVVLGFILTPHMDLDFLQRIQAF